MQTQTIPLDETDCFSSSFIDYISKKKELTPFYNTFPSISNFEHVIKNRRFSDDLRTTLSSALTSQYADLETSEVVKRNIDKLKNGKTFTVTTGHQLNVFTGPLYFIYKIVSVINTCKALKKQYPAYEFVPVYWMASEDHDFEEISYFHFEGKKIEWKTDQKGAVGRFDPSGLKQITDELPKGAAFFKEAYTKETLAEAVRSYVNHLFREEGLVVVDADDPELKKALIPVIEDDLFVHHAEDLVSKTSASLETAGYKAQVFARQINFFYLKDNIRERIEKTAHGFEVVDSDIVFSEEEIRKLIKSHPEQFSPNVILRPLYQEMILPNLAYIGGPSEAVYWLQLKSVFDHFKVDFPLLMPRNFALIIDKATSKKWDKTGLKLKELFLDSEVALTKWVKTNSNHNLSFQKELQQLSGIQKAMKSTSNAIDTTLTQHIEALFTGFSARIEKAEKKLLRAEKRKYEEKRFQIESVKSTLFPGGTLQERKDNFLNFYLKDPQFIQKLLDTFDPFNYQMYLLSE